ncbi:MAG: MFS transporter [SAR86 cluster bacterium BACL1 MAG-121105-bin34]|mgnify:FL=1|uniref:MFS transporter n=1 Tax=SAR86 cluster bacterium BACL1 MAG-120820-bin45 TaxID=1655612 RepID=A0A0R2UD18_9GAMM|nr:MAG: MFS transporter [SAR86 cluster bacterium BACL1 MAG-120507-bin14]KRO95306.1 MAG: MFS transporter [SAR86 cluster bacterium BACL1 MAG-120820-bin45]KRO97950.1 MAG: MFS transporter [SAR86 cluster bacterium BACL1 MAG-120813-bin36]KRO98276.1 MAG: MFS transporter [SAR86 cluster bacterium BACL1 MAG-120823-bin87]KRP01955.1 MAG: MFS transporter [SAR86 cluster bacterium BACL1 MAG-120619-bin26]KRP02940.1 MAG: MFS transporter [SAR86 cluster bacterium BACL1 MAG-120924-bin88]KRP12904.1 MAG: MFS trans
MSNPTSWLKFGLFSVGLGQSFAFVLVPPLARDLGLSVIETSSIFAISAIAWAVTSASWGRASDRYGRRNIAIIGLIGYSVSIIALITPLFLVEKNVLDFAYLLPLLVLGRLINGLIGSATRPAAFAYMADISDRSKRTKKFARLESSFLIGTIMGPMIGGFLFLYSKTLPFYVFALCGGIAAIGILLTFPKNIKQKTTEKVISKLSFKDSSVWPFLVLAALFSLCQASLLQSIGFFITDVFSTEKDLPLVISLTFGLLSISTVVSQYIFTDLKPIANNKLLIYGTFLLAISYIQAGLSTSIALFYLAMMVNGMGAGMVRPANAAALSIAQTPDDQGTAAGYLGSVIPIGHILTPLVAMPIYQYAPHYLYYFSAFLCFIALLFIIGHPILRDHEQTSASTS